MPEEVLMPKAIVEKPAKAARKSLTAGPALAAKAARLARHGITDSGDKGTILPPK